MRKAIFGLGFFLLIACGGESGTPDSGSGSAAASGEDANGGSTTSGGGRPSTGGSADRGGSLTGGLASGGSTASGGSATSGGSTASGGAGSDGEGGEAGASGGTGGFGTGGNTGQSGGSGGKPPTIAVCDPESDDATPYPDCEPRDASDSCELCIQAECCAESKTCYGYEPGNVCGWGGPTSGIYAGLSEVDCYVACVRDYVTEFGAYDDTTDNTCIPACTTSGCGLIGNATQDLVVCMRAHCDDECFLP